MLDPAVHGGNNVVSRHFLAVVELDARAQMVEIFAAIVVDLVGLAQLRLDVELRVERDERFIDVAVGDDTHGRVGDHHRVKRTTAANPRTSAGERTANGSAPARSKTARIPADPLPSTKARSNRFCSRYSAIRLPMPMRWSKNTSVCITS